jgi:predicted transcriptional regulator
LLGESKDKSNQEMMMEMHTEHNAEETLEVSANTAAPGDLRAALRDEMRRANLSQTSAALKIGFSVATLGRWLSGKYGADSAKVEEAVQKWLSMRKEQITQSVRVSKYVETPTSREIMGCLRHAPKLRRLGDYSRRAGRVKNHDVRTL